MQKALAPFTCKYTAQLPELLRNLDCSLAISTYQAGKLVFLSAKDEHSLVQLPRHFEKVMGIAESADRRKLALACKDEITVFADSPALAAHYPKAPGKYDALYLPRLTYHTGALDVHDLSFGKNDKLYAVNTLFSCVMTVDNNYNFTPFWQPEFIDKIASEDRCHLNGMAMENGKPKYVTAFNRGNSHQSWRENVTETGVIIDVETDEIIAENLAMPHSPRIFNGDLYVLLSATGELVRIDRKTGEKTTIKKLDGFVRGMSLHGEYLFIGLSKLRKNSSTFAKLNLKANRAAVVALHLPTGSIAGEITWLTSLDEIYDIHVLAGKTRPNILNTLTDAHKAAVMIPKSTFWAAQKPK